LSAKGKFAEAIQSYDQVAPRCEKTPAAHYKKAKALQQLGQSEEASKELAYIIRTYKGTNEAELAKRDLNQQ